MKFLLPFLLAALAGSNVAAQTWQSAKTQAREREERIRLLKSQPLLIRLQEEDPRKIKAMRARPKEVQAYRAYIGQLNKEIAAVAAKYWKFSPSIEYKSGAELDELLSHNTGQVNVLEYRPLQIRYGATVVGDAGRTQSASQSGFQLEAVVGKKTWIVDQQFVVGEEIHESDIIYCFQLIGYTLNGLQAKQYSGKATELTLLISQDNRSPGLTDAQVKQVYPYPFKFVGREEFEQAVRGGETGYCYVRFLPVPGHGCEAVAFTMPDAAIAAVGDNHEEDEALYLKQKDFKLFAKSIK